MSRKGRSEVQKQLDMVRVSQCRALGDCAQVLHQTGLELADDAEALLQVFTAVQQRLQKLELAQRRSNPASSHDLLAGLRHVVGKESLAVSAAEIKQPEPEAAEQQQQQQQSPPSMREIGLPELRKILDVGNNGSSDASQTGSLVWLMRGSKVTKVNRKNLQTADVHLFLSIEGATPAEPGWICARKVKDGSLRFVFSYYLAADFLAAGPFFRYRSLDHCCCCCCCFLLLFFLFLFLFLLLFFLCLFLLLFVFFFFFLPSVGFLCRKSAECTTGWSTPKRCTATHKN